MNIIQQNINYDRIVSGNDLDLINYKLKIKQLSALLTSDFDINLYSSLLTDLSVYSYFFLRVEEKPFILTAYQDAISQCKHDFTPLNPNRYIIFKASNQIGKSFHLISFAIHKAFTEDNINIILVSKSLPQSQFLLANIRFMLNNSVFSKTWREDLGEQANTTILTFSRDNGKVLNRIICAPSGEGLLGYPVHYLLLDEFDFYEDGKKFFWKIALPRTNKTKGQIICFSNPNPDISRSASILYELWTGDMFQRKFTFNFMDADWNTKQELEIAKRNSPSYIFASTHMGEFSDLGGSFFTHSEIQDMLQRDWNNLLPVVDRPVYIALDLGKMHDQTVLGIGVTSTSDNKDDKYPDLDIKYIEEFPLKTDYDIIADRIKELIDYYTAKHGVACVGFDATGQKTFGDFLKRMGISAMPVDFAAKKTNKTQLFNDLKLMVEKRKLKVIYSSKCEKQFSELMFKLTETKKLKVEARTENVHDDYVDMCAILTHIAVTPSVIPVTVTFVNSNSDTTNNNPGTDLDNFMRKTIMTDRSNYYNKQHFGGF